MKPKQIAKHILIVEKANNEFWGRIKVNNNLITDFAPTLEGLKRKLKHAVFEIENTNIENFEVSYDLTSFFEQYSFLNISDLAKRTEISPILMRQYTSGNKFPSEGRVKKIEVAIHNIGKELSKIKLHKSQRDHA